jgi:hypothetical protein
MATTHTPLPCVNKYCIQYVHIQCVRGGGYRVMLGSYSAGVLHSVMHLARFRTYKIARLLQTKTWGVGGGLRHIDTCRKVSFYVSFLR